LIEQSLNLKSILVYDGTMEKMVINNLIKLFPELKPELEDVKNKFIDVFDIFLEFNYYDPAFKTNFTLKTVSNVLLDDVIYSTITSGLEAMAYYDRYRNETNFIDKESIKEELISYCQTDTLATYKLVEFLKNLIK
jgi:predicted RecB family nuclease